MTKENKALTVVVGLGVTGLACVRYLVQQGVPVAVTDSRLAPPGLAALQASFPDIVLALGGFSRILLADASQIIVSPGVSLQEPAIAEAARAGKPILSDIELFAEHCTKPVVAITGSNGKTTVTTLLGLMVEAAGRSVAVCGNIGEPVLETLLAPAPDCYVMELSSFQLESTRSLKTRAAVVLNVSPDHMDRYACYEDYVAAKQRIYWGCEQPIVNQDEPMIWETLDLPSPLSFSVQGSAGVDFYTQTIEGELYLMHRNRSLIAASELKLQGQHHCQNALAALALGYALGLAFEPMLSVLRSFGGLPHRCQWVRSRDGVHWYNDSKGTNVGATQVAIETLGKQAEGKLVVIAGGVAKGATQADFALLIEPAKRYVSHFILMGQDAELVDNALRSSAPTTRVSTMVEAVSLADTLAQSGDIVLLSPACASFDMFDHYKQRGDVFIQAVNTLC